MAVYQPTIDTATVHAVRLAYQRQRSHARNWQSRQRSGRVDGKNVWRSETPQGTLDIFRERYAPGASKVNVHILVDGSGSMSSGRVPDGRSRIEAASDVTATLAEAFRTIPSVRLSIWLHNTSARVDVGGRRVEGDIAVIPIMTEGKGRRNIGAMPMLAHGGNGDGYAIAHVEKKMRRTLRKDEVGLIIVVSDGLPSWLADRTMTYWGAPAEEQAKMNDGTALVFNVVEDARKHGTKVLAIAIDPRAGGDNFVSMYGHDNVVPFSGDERAWTDLAPSLGARFGQVLAEANNKHK